MFLIIGLGNPGAEYENTGHNLGFLALNEFQAKNGFPSFRLAKKFNAEISEGTINSEKIVLAKPQTFMNNSGQAASSLIAFFKIRPENLFVVHDDIDLPLGSLRSSKNSGAAGHKGVESIIKAIGTKNFVRFRMGIQPAKGKPENVESYVLKKFGEQEKTIAKKAISETLALIKEEIKKGG